MKERKDFVVKDIRMEDWGRREIEIEEKEMKGMMDEREELGKQKKMKGERI